MSQENVEIVRNYFEAVERVFGVYWDEPRSAEAAVMAGEVAPEGAAMARYLHPNCEWKTALAGITYRGLVGMASGFDQLVEAAQAYGVEVREVDDLGGDQALAVVEVAMKGRSSDVDVNATIFAVVTVEDGLIIRIDEHLDRSKALEAVGLRE